MQTFIFVVAIMLVFDGLFKVIDLTRGVKSVRTPATVAIDLVVNMALLLWAVAVLA